MKKMRGVILAGGTGSRLSPCTKAVNKHLLPVGTKPMIYYPIERLVGAGITDILIVTGTEHMGMIVDTLGSGSSFGCHFNYAVQDTAFGIPDAIKLSRIFCDDSKFCVLLGDNIFTDSLEPHVNAFYEQDSGSRIILKQVSAMERFGVAFVNKNKKITEIIEKPNLSKRPVPEGLEGYAITGIYFYHSDVFNIISCLSPSSRHELEITDVHNSYLMRDQLSYAIMQGPWTDAGTFQSLAKASMMLEET